jgi:hypothetical protein
MNHVILHFDVLKRLREPLGRNALGLLTKEMLEEGDFGGFLVMKTDLLKIAMMTHPTFNREVHVDEASARRIATGYSSLLTLMATNQLPVGLMDQQTVNCEWTSMLAFNQTSATELVDKKVISDNGIESPRNLSVTSINGNSFSHYPQIDDFVFKTTVQTLARKNSCTVIAHNDKSHVWKMLQSEPQKQNRALIDLKDFSDYLEKAHQQKKSDQ